MSDFMPDPSIHLRTAEETIDAINDPSWLSLPYPGRWCVRSDFLVALIDEFKREGKYPYNSEVQRVAESRLGIPQMPDNQSTLSLLVYNAQKFRRSDRLRAQGLAPLTQEMIDRAGEGGKVLIGETVFNVRHVGGKLHLMKPRARNRGVFVNDQPAKIVQYGKAALQAMATEV